MQSNKAIKFWADDDKPREKMIHKGPHALSDAELIGILLATGSREKSAVDLGREIMQLADNKLNKLSRFTISQLQQIKGIGEAKAVTIVAAMELGRRRQSVSDEEMHKVTSSRSVAEFLIPLMQDLEVEKFCVVYLNNSNKLIGHEFISHGGQTATVVDIKIILRNAVLRLAKKIIVAHNHPSGSTSPSPQDRTLTEKLKNAAVVMDVELVDHIIVAGTQYVSFADEDWL